MLETVVLSPFSRPAEAEDALLRGLPIACRVAAAREERELHLEIRHEVFVREQRFFEGTDRDAHDVDPATVHVLGLCGQVAGGAVRLYPLEEPGRWKGDRLAVLPPFRGHRMGAPLVRFAVRIAAERGGSLMVAHIQVQNVSFFEHLGWYRVGEPVEFVGRPHQVMAIDLTAVETGV